MFCPDLPKAGRGASFRRRNKLVLSRLRASGVDIVGPTVLAFNLFTSLAGETQMHPDARVASRDREHFKVHLCLLWLVP